MIAVSAVVLGIVALAYAAFQLVQREFPSVEILATHYPVIVYSGAESPPTVELTPSRPAGWVRLGSVSDAAESAILVSEDWGFYSHPGYDLDQMREAMQHDLRQGRFARGASTITQQVVRNVFLSREKTLWRKVRELILAARLDRTIGKRRTLEIYLNIAEWGPGFYGIGAASRFYFDKPPSQLTAREGAFLAMLLPSPVRYGQSFRQKRLSPYARKTMESILSKMVRASRLSEEDRDGALSERMGFEQVDGQDEGPEEGAEEPPES